MLGVTLKTHMRVYIDVVFVLKAQEISSTEGGAKRLTGDRWSIKVGPLTTDEVKCSMNHFQRRMRRKDKTSETQISN